MATATIPELIQPGVLYTPDNTALSINTGWCPNTDDALQISGTTANFRAYQPAISGIHYPSAVGNPFMIQMWFDSGSTVTLAANNQHQTDDIIAGVMDINVAAGGSPGTIGFSTATAGRRWTFATYNNSGPPTLTVSLILSVGATSSAAIGTDYSGTSKHTAGKHQLALGVDSGARYCYGDGVNNWASPLCNNAGTPGTPGALTAPFFALGPYATGAGWSFVAPPSAATKIAKFSIWNRILTTTELSDLYTSMTLGPPSP